MREPNRGAALNDSNEALAGRYNCAMWSTKRRSLRCRCKKTSRKRLKSSTGASSPSLELDKESASRLRTGRSCNTDPVVSSVQTINSRVVKNSQRRCSKRPLTRMSAAPRENSEHRRHSALSQSKIKTKSNETSLSCCRRKTIGSFQTIQLRAISRSLELPIHTTAP